MHGKRITGMKRKRVNVVTMGCSKNLVDSEVLLNQLEKGKFDVVHDSNEPGFDAVFVNTCGFIHDAKQESIDMILDYAEAKKRGDIEKLFVMGCLSERYKKELETEIPEVDRYFGKFDLKAMVDELNVAVGFSDQLRKPGKGPGLIGQFRSQPDQAAGVTQAPLDQVGQFHHVQIPSANE